MHIRRELGKILLGKEGVVFIPGSKELQEAPLEKIETLMELLETEQVVSLLKEWNEIDGKSEQFQRILDTLKQDKRYKLRLLF